MPPHAQNGTLSFFNSLPPYDLAQVESDVPPHLDPLEMLATPAPASLPSEPLACTPMHIPQQVLEAIARAKVYGQVSTPADRALPTHHTTTHAPCVGGPVAEAIARMTTGRTALHERDSLAEQAERDGCTATAKVLQRAGRAGQAATIMQSAPPHRPPRRHPRTWAGHSLSPHRV